MNKLLFIIGLFFSVWVLAGTALQSAHCKGDINCKRLAGTGVVANSSLPSTSKLHNCLSRPQHKHRFSSQKESGEKLDATATEN